MVTAVSDVEAFVQRLIISKRQNGCAAGHNCFRGDGDVCFARAFYALCRDIVKLADVLGHSSIDTTRIYLRTTGAEHVRQLERLHQLC